MSKKILESKCRKTTVGELISLLEKYPKDLPFYYCPESTIEDFKIAEVYDNSRLMFLAISTKKTNSCNDEINSKDINSEVICH